MYSLVIPHFTMGDIKSPSYANDDTPHVTASGVFVGGRFIL